MMSARLLLTLFLCLLKRSTGFSSHRHAAARSGHRQQAMMARQATSNMRTENQLTYEDYEERERKEMKYLVETTSKLIGDAALPVGSLRRTMTSKAYGAMQTWARRSALPKSNAPYVVEQIFDRLVQERDSGNEHARINTHLYNVVLDSWSKSDEDGAANKAEAILMSMETMYASGDKDVRPNRASFNNVIKACVKTGDKHNAVTKTESILAHMTKLSETNIDYSPPNRRGYNLLLYALASSDLDNAGERAEQILQRMIMEEAAEADSLARPDINSYNLVIKIWAKGTQRGFERRAQAVFDQIMALPPNSDVKPNYETFNFILGCWSKSMRPEALNQTLQLLTTCEEAFNNGNSEAKPDCVTINTVISKLARSSKKGSLELATELQRKMERQYQIKPDTISNNILIDCWSKSGRPNATKVVVDMLNRMELQFRKGNKNAKPDRYSYTSVMDAFIRSGGRDAGERCSEILTRMKDFHTKCGGDAPTVENYNSLVNAWANVRTRDGANMALGILSEMEGNPTVPNPDLCTYNTVLKALRNGARRHALVAEEILYRLEGHESLNPDSFSYSTVMNALGRCDLMDKAERVLRILQRMVSEYEEGNGVKPNLHCFNAALNACAFQVGGDAHSRQKAFAIMVGVLVLLQKYARPDHLSFGTILRACSTLLPIQDPRREDLVGRVFEKARREGQVSPLVMEQLCFAASSKLYRKLMGVPKSERVAIQDLPVEWTSSVSRQ